MIAQTSTVRLACVVIVQDGLSIGLGEKVRVEGQVALFVDVSAVSRKRHLKSSGVRKRINVGEKAIDHDASR